MIARRSSRRLFTAAQAAQKAAAGVGVGQPGFTAAQAAQKTPDGRSGLAMRFTAAQAAQKAMWDRMDDMQSFTAAQAAQKRTGYACFIPIGFTAAQAAQKARGLLGSRPCEIQTAASSRSDVAADKRVAAVLAVAPGAFGGFSNAPTRAPTHMTTADKAQKSPCRPRRVMARSSQRML